MSRQYILGLTLLLVAAGASAGAPASVDRYRLDHDGLKLEISAPRADILRVRAGRQALAEDASWAVSADVRGRLQPLSVAETGTTTELRTSALVLKIDKATLHLRIEDVQGNVVLEDAPGRALAFEHAPAAATAAAGAGVMSSRLRKLMPEDAHYFGLGDKAGALDRRGAAFTLWTTDAFGFGESSDPLYKSIPFVLGVLENGRSFGLFFDNTWRSFFDFGKSEREVLSFGAEGGGVDYYVMAGSGPKQIVQAYAYLTGTAALAPRWALGFQQCRYSYETEAQARAVADRLRADRIPADVLYLDIDYQDRNRPFTVSGTAFPDLPRFVADLKAMDLRVILITDLHIAAAASQNYSPYDSGTSADVFLKRADGSTYVADVWPGKSVFPDFSRAPARDWWGGLYHDFTAMGVAGFWNDMNEPAIFNVREKTMPLDTVHRIDEPGFQPRAASHAEMHNVYGMLNSRATNEGLLRLQPQQRPFVLTRASYAGGQRYAATWTGDNTSSWNHLRLSVSMLNNLGLSGFGYSGDDIGGFAGAGPSADLLTRWIEVGAFNPIFRDHTAKGKPQQEVWVNGPEHEAIRKRYIEERYRLLPYIYALAEENSRTGMPLMRPVFLEFPQQLGKGQSLGGSADQFMLGPNLLVAPPPEWESPYAYDIVLPGKGWYDYWTGLRQTSDTLKETPRLERLPVFVRPGAIVPRQALTQSTVQTPDGPLELAIYPGPDCETQLYFDDGVSFSYRNGAYLRQSVRCHDDAHAFSVEFGTREGHYHAWWHELELAIHGVSAPPRSVHLGTTEVTGNYDAASQTLRIRIPDQAVSSRLTIDMP